MVNRKRTKNKQRSKKTLHRKLKIEQQEPRWTHVLQNGNWFLLHMWYQ